MSDSIETKSTPTSESASTVSAPAPETLPAPTPEELIAPSNPEPSRKTKSLDENANKKKKAKTTSKQNTSPLEKEEATVAPRQLRKRNDIKYSK